MICNNCQTVNSDNNKFCKNCGSIIEQNFQISNNDFASAKLVFIGLMIQLFVSLSQSLFYQFVKPFERWMWDIKMAATASIVFNILFYVGLLMIPLSIKKTSLKVVGIILVTILTLFWIGINLKDLFK
jgi:hypothetical protein